MISLPSSTYYYQGLVPAELREKQDAELRAHIERVQMTHPKSGYRTVREYLERAGIHAGERKIRRIMRKFGLRARVRRFIVRTTDSRHGYQVYPNLLLGLRVTCLNQVWVADITYIHFVIRFVFLAVILDLYSRKVIGWNVMKSLETDLTLGALNMALARRKPEAGLIHHSDRGVQYLSHRYTERLRENKIRISNSAKGNPYDNAFMERFMRTLKEEEVHLANYQTYLDVLEHLPDFIEEVYNKKRVHSALGYLTPEEMESLVTEKSTQVADRFDIQF